MEGCPPQERFEGGRADGLYGKFVLHCRVKDRAAGLQDVSPGSENTPPPQSIVMFTTCLRFK